MTNQEFKLWLQGYLELSANPSIDLQQWHILKNHADLVLAVDGKLEPEIQQLLEDTYNRI